MRPQVSTATADLVEAITLHVAESWAMERDRLTEELRAVRGRLAALESYMEGAEQTPENADPDIRAELSMLNDRMTRLTATVAEFMAGTDEHSVRADA